MRRGALIIVAAAVCLALGPGASSAQTSAKASGATKPAPTPATVPVVQEPYNGPGYGGRGQIGPIPAVRFLGVTTRTFPVGVGALVASRACNEEHPVSRLCEWADIFAALPPIHLDTEVLVAPNYVTNPITSCLNPNGGLHCRSLAVRLPAACCGFIARPVGPLATLILSPGGDQAVTDCSATITFTAQALDVNGAPLEGELVLFAIPPVVGGTSLFFGVFSPSIGSTDANGEVSSTLSLDVTTCEANCTDGHDCTARVQARNSAGTILSNDVLLVDQIP